MASASTARVVDRDLGDELVEELGVDDTESRVSANCSGMVTRYRGSVERSACRARDVGACRVKSLAAATARGSRLETGSAWAGSRVTPDGVERARRPISASAATAPSRCDRASHRIRLAQQPADPGRSPQGCVTASGSARQIAAAAGRRSSVALRRPERERRLLVTPQQVQPAAPRRAPGPTRRLRVGRRVDEGDMDVVRQLDLRQGRRTRRARTPAGRAASATRRRKRVRVAPAAARAPRPRRRAAEARARRRGPHAGGRRPRRPRRRPGPRQRRAARRRDDRALPAPVAHAERRCRRRAAAAVPRGRS